MATNAELAQIINDQVTSLRTDAQWRQDNGEPALADATLVTANALTAIAAAITAL